LTKADLRLVSTNINLMYKISPILHITTKKNFDNGYATEKILPNKTLKSSPKGEGFSHKLIH